MGNKINSSEDETCPRITFDGKYFFFTRTKNWDGDLYWVTADFIDSLRVANTVSIIKTIHDELNDIKVYPNPSNGIITISKKQVSQEISYCVTDQFGKVILTGKLENSAQSLNLTELPKGLYILRCKIDGKDKNMKILLY